MQISDLIIALQDHNPSNTLIFDDGNGNCFTVETVQQKKNRPVTVVILAPADPL